MTEERKGMWPSEFVKKHGNEAIKAAGRRATRAGDDLARAEDRYNDALGEAADADEAYMRAVYAHARELGIDLVR
jgi:hypothetical protein